MGWAVHRLKVLHGTDGFEGGKKGQVGQSLGARSWGLTLFMFLHSSTKLWRSEKSKF